MARLPVSGRHRPVANTGRKGASGGCLVSQGAAWAKDLKSGGLFFPNGARRCLKRTEGRVTVVMQSADIPLRRGIGLTGPRHPGHAFRQVADRTRRTGREDGRAQQHRLFGPGCDDRFSGGIGKDLSDKVRLPCPATDRDAVDRRACLVLRFDDLAQAIADAAQTRDIQRGQAGQITLHAQTADDRPCMRVGKGRAVAQEFRHDMKPVSQPRRVGKIGHRRLRLRGKEHRQRHSRITTQPRRLGCCGVHCQKLLDRRTGGRLPALVQPEVVPQCGGDEVTEPLVRERIKRLRDHFNKLAQSNQLAPEVLARRRWIEALARDPERLPEPFTGWRAGLIGSSLGELM